MIWKPSHSTPLVAIAIQHVANRVMADHGVSGVFNLVVGDRNSVGNRMLEDTRLPLISFTGSVSVGRTVATSIGQRLGRSILELGGNNGIIVAEDADLDMATRGIVFGAVGTAGQRCTSMRRVIMQKGISADLTQRLVNAYKQVSIGDPLDEGTLMGPLVDGGAVDDMMAAIETAKAQGGEVLTGGNKLEMDGGYFVEPTIIKMP